MCSNLSWRHSVPLFGVLKQWHHLHPCKAPQSDGTRRLRDDVFFHLLRSAELEFRFIKGISPCSGQDGPTSCKFGSQENHSNGWFQPLSWLPRKRNLGGSGRDVATEGSDQGSDSPLSSRPVSSVSSMSDFLTGPPAVSHVYITPSTSGNVTASSVALAEVGDPKIERTRRKNPRGFLQQ